jgi:hypothetical protein
MLEEKLSAAHLRKRPHLVGFLTVLRIPVRLNRINRDALCRLDFPVDLIQYLASEISTPLASKMMYFRPYTDCSRSRAS